MANLILLLFTISLLSAGCYVRTKRDDAAFNDPVRSIEDASRQQIDGGNAFIDASTPPADRCGLLNQTRLCDCENSRGRQVCEPDGWSDCECTVVNERDSGIEKDGAIDAQIPISTPAGDERPDVSFRWGSDAETERPTEDCKEGRYSGFFEGYYISYITPGVSQYIAATPTENSSGLEFDLVKVSAGESFEIRGGKLIGMTETAAPVPFEADIIGTLDCTTGVLNAELANGYYEYLSLSGRFEGQMMGQYNFESQSFESGTWTVRELDPDSGLPHEENGGDGTWNATLVP